MRKVYVLLLVQLLVFGTASYGAVSDDIYVRKDVFDAKIEALFNRLHGDIQALSERMDGNFAKLSERIDGLNTSLSERIDGVNASLSGRIDGVNASLSGRIDSLDKRIDDLRNGIYLWLAAVGIVIAWPKVSEKFQNWRKSQPSVTLEDVRRLIEENNAKLQGKPQI